MTFYTMMDSPLGRILMTSDGAALTGLYFEGQRHAPAVSVEWQCDGDAEPFVHARQWLTAYFAGIEPDVAIPLAPRGTPFQQRVWREIARIPRGQTITYRELANRTGLPTGVRAAGAATGRNPISLLVPCHRVVGSDGSLTGYAGGLERKRALLALEVRAKQRSAQDAPAR